MLTLSETFFIGAGAVLALLGVAEAFARVGGQTSLFKTVVIGLDNRTSTSKTFIFMWLVLIGWALVSMLIAGELITTHSCAAGSAVRAAIDACTSQRDQVGMLQIGWAHFLNAGVSAPYLALLGVPAAAGIGAKAITQSKTDSGTLFKTIEAGVQKLAPRIAQLFTADDHTTDVGDLQYVIFNLVAAAYFVTTFIQPSTQGLPVIPGTLAGLAGVSGALYLGKKAASRTRPTITGVFPSILLPDHPFTITGNSLVTNRAQQVAGGSTPQVSINGVLTEDVKPDPQGASQLTGRVPLGLIPPGSLTPVMGSIQVRTDYGAVTPQFPVQLA